MIIELAVGAGIVIIGAIALRMAGRRSATPPPETPGPEADARPPLPAPVDRSEPRERPPRTARDPSPRGLRVGDVLLHMDTEIWLAGEVHLDEEGFVLSLFAAPGARAVEFVAQLDPEAREVSLLCATRDVPDGCVPAELPVGGVRLSLRRKGNAVVRTEGEHLPRVAERATYTILSGPGGRTLVVVDFEHGDRLALVGDHLAREMYDLLPGGDLADE